MRALVIYDGTLEAREGLRYGLKLVKERGGDLVCLNIFNITTFIGYEAIPMVEELARKEFYSYIEEAKRIISLEGNGVRTKMITEEGEPEEEIINFITDRYVDILFCPPRYSSIIKKYNRELEEKGRRVVPGQSTLTGVTSMLIETV